MKRLFSQLHRPLRNERGEITFFACFFVVGVVMLISFLLLYASVRITCINIRNGATWADLRPFRDGSGFLCGRSLCHADGPSVPKAFPAPPAHRHPVLTFSCLRLLCCNAG